VEEVEGSRARGLAVERRKEGERDEGDWESDGRKRERGRGGCGGGGGREGMRKKRRGRQHIRNWIEVKFRIWARNKVTCFECGPLLFSVARY
jgi:hypothetical protein